MTECNDYLESYGFELEHCPRCGEMRYLTGVPVALYTTQVPICGDCAKADSHRKEHAYGVFQAEGVFPLPPFEEWREFPGGPIGPDQWPLAPEEVAWERAPGFIWDLTALREAAMERRHGSLPPIV